MSNSEIPEVVRVLLRETVHSISALELLLFLARNPDKTWRADEVAAAIWPVSLTPSAAAEFLELFRANGLVETTAESRLRYRPATAELAAAMDALAKVHAEKPVSVMRAIYAPAPSKIQTFADAFRIRKNP